VGDKRKSLMVLRHLQEEVENSNHRFDMPKSWRLFKGFRVPVGWSGLLFDKDMRHAAQEARH
jgi:hypothetical protein